MKKFDLVHTTILIIALLAGYSALEQVLAILTMVGYVTSVEVPGGFSQTFFFTVLSFIFSLGCCLLLIWKGGNIAFLIMKNEPQESQDATTQLQLDRWNIIFVLFIGMGLYTIIQSIPYLVRDLYDLFKNKAATDLFRGPGPDSRTVVLESLKVLLGAFLIYAAAPFTNFIDKIIASKLKSDS